MTGFPDFATFFRGLWGFDPFPWQAMLAERVALGHWPQALDLPTASGKTACIEVALWALASQADRPLAERTVPRRIWFVVDRRIVVDEAFERARTIAGKLAGPGEGPLGEVANRLRRIAGTDRPLAVARLRGGIFRDDGWARLPSQPTVITSTVDQVGSRLLFRGYGRSHMTAPIFAGLAANDSLVLLDEAHCSVPFLQTLRAIETYRGTRWAESPLATPFAFAVLSATPPPDIPEDAVFPGAAREQALGHPVLQQRLQARKPADLVELKTKGKGEQEDPVVTEAVRRVQAHLVDGKRRVAVMVNRVWTASGIAEALRECVGENADVVLLTGRMRPYERDRTVDRWKPFLKADSPGDPPKPIVVVSTQCLEVGADFSFDALITEAASLDALRQRFGRLDRMGAAGTSRAAILIRDRNADLEKSEPDAVYGEALARTWQLLKERAEVGSLPTIDFGVEALRKQLGDVDNLSPYLAPTADAPMLLPAHLDLLCQTAPTAEPEPDVQLFLHGKDRGAPEVRVVWRADLDLHDDDRAWLETIALCPPASGEMLAVPNYRLRAWLAESGAADDAADVEGVPASGEAERGGKGRRCLLWRGRDRSRVAKRADEIMPGEVVIVPAAYGMEGLGQPVAVEALGRARLDLWEPVLRSAGRPAAVRLNRAALEPWLECSPLSQLVTLAETPFWEREEIQEAIDAVLEYQLADEGGAAPPPSWWLDLLRETRSGRFEPHPAGGVVLFARGTANALRTAEPDLFADDDDLTSSCARGVSLDEHSDMVKRTVEKLARHCLPEELLAVLRLAAWWHDVGKLDERFQVLLHQGDELAALSADTPLAKSASIPTSPARRRTLREASGLPQSFRHEMLSAQIAERHAPLPDDRDQADLFLHLVASHHGHVRPFAPISADLEPTAVEGRLGDTRIVLSAEERATWTPHRVDSGLADRFWRLTRRYGWWGLAYLEAVLRLGDWYASGLVIKPGSQGEAEP